MLSHSEHRTTAAEGRSNSLS